MVVVMTGRIARCLIIMMLPTAMVVMVIVIGIMVVMVKSQRHVAEWEVLMIMVANHQMLHASDRTCGCCLRENEKQADAKHRHSLPHPEPGISVSHPVD